MSIKHILVLLVVVSGACLTSCVTVPAVAKTEGGEMFMGKTTATLASGTYKLTSVEGKTIEGKYNPYNMSKSRVFDFTISDGRTGRVIVNSISDTAGWGIGKLSTGEKCKFMYGNAAVSMDFSLGF
jgi:hypothetical protein